MRPFAHNFVFLVLALPAAAQSTAASSQQAQVTFYSDGVTVLGGLPGQKPGAFKGRIFDQDHQLAFIEPGRFITFNLPPGTHVFSATNWLARHAKDGAHLSVDLIAGEHYFVQTLTLSSYLGSTRIFINSVTCEGAANDNIHSKPLEPAHLRPDGGPIAIPETSFPICPH